MKTVFALFALMAIVTQGCVVSARPVVIKPKKEVIVVKSSKDNGLHKGHYKNGGPKQKGPKK